MTKIIDNVAEHRFELVTETGSAAVYYRLHCGSGRAKCHRPTESWRQRHYRSGRPRWRQCWRRVRCHDAAGRLPAASRQRVR